MRRSTALVISVGIGMAPQSAHLVSARESGAELVLTERSFSELTDADVTPRVEAHAAVVVRKITETVRAIRCIWAQRKVRVGVPDRNDEVYVSATERRTVDVRESARTTLGSRISGSETS